MTTFTNQSKSSAPSFTNQSEGSVSYGTINQVKAGQGWLFNQIGILFNSIIDPISKQTVQFNGDGTQITWANQSES